MPIKTIIMGAAGRDFHNFNTFFRGNKDYEVVAFTATQIPDIEGRVYPKELAGDLYPSGIPIRAEEELLDLIKKYGAEQVVFSYSDVPHEYVMHKASMVNAAGADFRIMGTKNTQIKSNKPVVSISAVRTGSGKSQTTRRVAAVLQEMGYKVAAIRHPMPYGNLVAQEVQRYATYDDLDEYQCTIEEREEYEPHIDSGVIIYAGVDYEKIIRKAEAEADIVLWDGGNNDFPFYRPDLLLVDYRLPQGHTGLDALTASRAQWPGRMLPAIVITGSTIGGHEAEAAEHDFHLLIKPVLPNKLRAMIAFKLGVR